MNAQLVKYLSYNNGDDDGDEDPKVGEIRRKFLKIAEEFFEPMKYKNTREILEFLDYTRADFTAQSGDLIRNFIIHVGLAEILKDKDEIKKTLSALGEQFHRPIAKFFSESWSVEIDNELILMNRLSRRKQSAYVSYCS